MVVVVVLLVTGAGCGVTVVADCVVPVVTLREGMVAVGSLALVVEATVVVVRWTESVGASCRGGRGDT